MGISTRNWNYSAKDRGDLRTFVNVEFKFRVQKAIALVSLIILIIRERMKTNILD